MNSFKSIKILAMALILLITLTGYVTGSDIVPASLTEPDSSPPIREQQALHQDSSAKKIALSGAAQLFKDTRIGKNLNQYRQRLIRNVRFEYRKTLKHKVSASEKNIPNTEHGEKESLKSVSFSGELDPNLSPVFEVNSRLNIIDFSSALHLVDHEVECDISSRPVNDFLGGRAAIGFSTDGKKTEALIRFKFDL
ncbi:hypothetical protein [uncultured Desulfobacter sp.]|uniref:hypothetical protein n=1 Tax=uncultured Desulfobacter sp. TaxID=240139 RepID=UPI002AA7743F|nr:hypothetical protein [uncultured Desulfobacter sp.]